MKCNLFAGLLVAAALAFVSSANAQDALVATDAAPAQPAAQVQTTDVCNECEGGVVLGSGLGLRGRVVGLRAGWGERSNRFRTNLENRLYVRDVVAPSPYAVPSGELQDWSRFKHYPYGYYQHNFRDASGQPASMGLQMFNPAWQNYYPAPRRFHEGKHFILDVF
ncbi:MAG: hypothetical protein IJO06_09915 [Thermoguttaceae bacterium]|nr:hypothetical protein [Thermoguttaceae bacterium]MBQ7111527.1 hypothetical protein [Thermoguttaceae bacterium]